MILKAASLFARIPLLTDEAARQKRTHERCLESSYRIDFIDSFPSLVAFAANPVSVEVGADPVQHFAGEPVVLPLLGVELQDTLIHQIFPILKTR